MLIKLLVIDLLSQNVHFMFVISQLEHHRILMKSEPPITLDYFTLIK